MRCHYTVGPQTIVVDAAGCAMPSDEGRKVLVEHCRQCMSYTVCHFFIFVFVFFLFFLSFTVYFVYGSIIQI